MNNEEEQRLKLLKSGPTGSKRLGPRFNPSKKKPSGLEKVSQIVLTKDEEIEETEEDIIFKPNKGPQTDFLSASEREVLYGGAAGGEPKSWFSASFPSNGSK